MTKDFIYLCDLVPPPEAPKPVAKPAAAPAAPAPPPVVGVSEDGYTDVEVTNMRRTIAKRLTQSKVCAMIFSFY